MQKEALLTVVGILVVSLVVLFVLDSAGIPLGQGTGYQGANIPNCDDFDTDRGSGIACTLGDKLCNNNEEFTCITCFYDTLKTNIYVWKKEPCPEDYGCIRRGEDSEDPWAPAQCAKCETGSVRCKGDILGTCNRRTGEYDGFPMNCKKYSTITYKYAYTSLLGTCEPMSISFMSWLGFIEKESAECQCTYFNYEPKEEYDANHNRVIVGGKLRSMVTKSCAGENIPKPGGSVPSPQSS